MQDQINQLEVEKIDHLNQLAALQTVASQEKQPKISNIQILNSKKDYTLPELTWMVDWWQTETFERDSAILKMIAETGLARRPLIEAQAAEMLGGKKPGGSI